MEQKSNLLDVFQTLVKWRTPILWVCLITGVGSVIITLLLPNYYKATTVFLASSPDQAKPEVIFGLSNTTAKYYGNADDIDRILTLGESKELIDFLADSFNLYEHYEIDRESNRARYNLEKKVGKYLELVKTNRDALELSYEDKDGEFASRVANAARDKIDQLSQKLVKETQSKAISTLSNNLIRKREVLIQLADSLRAIRKQFGIFNIEAQTEALSQQLAEADAQLTRGQARLQSLSGKKGIPQDTITYLQAETLGREAEVAQLNQRMEKLNEGLGITQQLEVQYTDATNTMTNDYERLKRWRAAFESSISGIILIQEARPPVFKSRPRRSVLVLASVAIAFFFSLLGVLVIDLYRTVDWNTLLNAR